MGRLAVVSGGGTGIGRAVAAALAAEGSEVVVVGRRPEPLAAVAAGLPGVRAVTADLTDPAQVARAAKEIGGPVDVLVNNAGGNFAPAPPEPGDLETLRAQWLANVTGNVLPVVLLTEALLPVLSRPGGRIVTITSVAAFRGPATYGGSKAALHPWSAELAARLAPEGVTVNVVAPGYIPETEFYGERMNAEFHAGRSAQSPSGRGGTPAEVAATVAHLASPLAGFLTGQIIQINGGAIPGRG
ncbi:SDR family NAD(P)-dependent oxidoreductase [Longispora albida]|uniref:SDR family NAD(P)-dependent oxidoreductase n=1 Tax=Longispora albida TaxID=203523 RepID=UPI0004771E26|nr:SDR family oxidoreductase [Longispora albida]